MKKTTILLFGIISLLFSSCDNNDEKRAEYTQIAQSRSTQELLQDLFVGSDSDVEAIARILNCTPSSINRIRKGETIATTQFSERVVDVSVYYYLNKQSFSKLREELDPEWKWYNSYLYWPKNHPLFFWTITILLFIGLAIFALVFVWPLLVELILFLICWIISLFGQPVPIEDRYLETFNPLIEQVENYNENMSPVSKTKTVKRNTIEGDTTKSMSQNKQQTTQDSIQ